METLWQDVRYGARMLVKRPGFTVTAVLVLALGIGANTAIFSAVHAILLRPLPYRDADRIVVPASTKPAENIERASVSYPDFLDWRNEREVFEHVAVYRPAQYDLTGAGEPERISAAIVSEDYFAVMGAPPVLGRTFQPEDYQEIPRASVLSYGLWQRHFGANPQAVGQEIEVNGVSRTIVGVMPPDSQWPDDAELWLPLSFSASSPAEWAMRRDNMVWYAVARLRAGATLEQARAVLGTIARRIEQEDPASRRGWGATAYTLREWIVGSTLRQTLLVLLGAVGFVLLIACVNIANLLLARGAAREREIAIRTALGAGRFRLIRQFLVESLLLGLLGGGFGLLLAFWGIDLLVALAPDDIPRLQETAINAPVLAFVVTISLLTATAFGIIPALHATRVDLNESLKEGGRGSTGGAKGKRARHALVISEVALSMVLLVGAGLLIRSFTLLQQVDPGLNVDGLITFNISLPRARYPESAQVTNFYDRALERIRALPGVESAAATSALPLGGGGFYLGRVFLGETHPEPPAGPDYPAQWNTISNDYFRVLGTPLLRGRAFDERDTSASIPVTIINETMARRMFPNQDPIGQRIRSWRDENILREIVGVVSDVRYFGRDDELRPLVYVPLTQDTNRALMLAVRTTGEPPQLIGSLREAIWSLDGNLAVADAQTMRQILDESVARPRFNMMLLGIFAAVAMILAAIGLYGILAYAVAQRTHEIGIRIALGAGRRDVLRLVVGQGLKLALAGLGIGLVAAFALTRVMSSLLYGISATDPLTFIGVALLLAAVALLASYIPARRATKVDPMIALRYE